MKHEDFLDGERVVVSEQLAQIKERPLIEKVWLLLSNITDEGKFRVVLEINGVPETIFHQNVEQSEGVVSHQFNLTWMLTRAKALDAANLKIQELEERVLALQMIEPKELQEANDRADRHLGERNKLQARIAELEAENERHKTLYKDASIEIDRKRTLIVGYCEKIQALEAEKVGLLQLIDGQDETISALKSENERLKAELLSLAPMKSNFQAIQVELEGTRRQFDRLAKQNAQYKTALEYAISKTSGDVKNALVDVLKSGGES